METNVFFLWKCAHGVDPELLLRHPPGGLAVRHWERRVACLDKEIERERERELCTRAHTQSIIELRRRSQPCPKFPFWCREETSLSSCSFVHPSIGSSAVPLTKTGSQIPRPQSQRNVPAGPSRRSLVGKKIGHFSSQATLSKIYCQVGWNNHCVIKKNLKFIQLFLNIKTLCGHNIIAILREIGKIEN